MIAKHHRQHPAGLTTTGAEFVADRRLRRCFRVPRAGFTPGPRHRLERWKIFIYNRFMKIPSTIRSLLWEYSFGETASDARWDSTIIERVMQRGCWDDMLWLLRTFDRERLRAFLERRGKRALAPRELRFWARICSVPDDEQDTWVYEARKREHAWR